MTAPTDLGTPSQGSPRATGYTACHHVWPEPERVVLPAGADSGGGLVVTNRCLRRDGQTWVPISGEIHYSRLERRLWPLAVQLLQAGGINLVSTYVFWNHHQPRPDTVPDFTGNRDVSAFLRLCADQQLPVIIRVGPWCHGESRNGGFPDWVQDSGFANRTDDPGYLAMVEPWFRHLGRQIGPWCGPDGPIVAVQVENELYDQPEHIVTLKTLAQRAGITASIWTATGWGNAQLPLPEVFPVYSGYSDGFWVDAEEPWDDSFRSHFFFCDLWDDPGVGKDLAGDPWTGIAGAKHPDLPPATCELAGGMASAYHCRPVPSGLDVAALANVKLGSGSAWQGYYMYVGGTNPESPNGLQESHATGYPNDLPRFNYDFHAPVGRDLHTRDSFHRLRLQHAFLAAFGDQLATMTTTFPASPTPERPLRWSLRSDGRAGFVFVNNHQPIQPLNSIDDVQFAVQLDDEQIVFPPEPVTIPASSVLALPIGLTLGGVTIRWATTNLITRLDAEEPVLVGYAHPGLAAQIGIPADHRIIGADAHTHAGELIATLTPGTTQVTVEAPTGDRIHLIILDHEQALRAWTPTIGGRPHLLLSDADIIERGNQLVALAEEPDTVLTFSPRPRTWTAQPITPHPITGRGVTTVQLELRRHLPEGHPPRRSFGGRASAPTRAEITAYSARYQLRIDPIPDDVERAVLVVDLVADVGEIAVAGHDDPFDDLFWDGQPWTINLTRFAGTTTGEFEIRLTAFDPETTIRLPDRADRLRRDADSGAIIHTAELRLTRSTTLTINHPSASEA